MLVVAGCVVVGAPDAAVQGFLRSTGMMLEQLEVREGAKGKTAVIEGRSEGELRGVAILR